MYLQFYKLCEISIIFELKCYLPNTLFFQIFFLELKTFAFLVNLFTLNTLQNFLDISKKKIHLSDCFNDSVLLERTAVDENKPNC